MTMHCSLPLLALSASIAATRRTLRVSNAESIWWLQSKDGQPCSGCRCRLLSHDPCRYKEAAKVQAPFSPQNMSRHRQYEQVGFGCWRPPAAIRSSCIHLATCPHILAQSNE